MSVFLLIFFMTPRVLINSPTLLLFYDINSLNFFSVKSRLKEKWVAIRTKSKLDPIDRYLHRYEMPTDVIIKIVIQHVFCVEL